ncbi:hypothetical protein D9757_005982 [Collybiopsis confluens]|uniref:BZIP domain-containing protein n=1 Tax=Collybiopsis confluens TaxID=2823264 RepID=A0A8H5HV05_9AGAR|nr:hypothetical protein D9757_005982 [Collybiopsis confluens]
MDGNMNMFQYFRPTGELQDQSTTSNSYDHAAAAAYLRSTGIALSEPSPGSYITEDTAQGPSSSSSSYFPHHEALPHPSLGNNNTPPSAVPHNNDMHHHHHHHHTSSSSSTGSGSNSRGNSNRTRHSSPTSPLDHSINPYPPASSRPRRSPNQRILSLPDDPEDDSEEEPLPANASAKEKFEWKKRRNTKAARRSRKRKQVYTEQLEATVEQLRLEKETWKTRALTLRQLLKSHNMPCPDFED